MEIKDKRVLFYSFLSFFSKREAQRVEKKEELR
jgi:hypothetical protein